MSRAKSSQRRAIVVVVDGWGAEYAGPYGNTWLDTPSLNYLAAHSMLCEHAVAESTNLSRLYAALWRGESSLGGAGRDLIQSCRAAGRSTCLITDEDQVASCASATAFSDQIVMPPQVVDQLASTFDQTTLAGLFSQVVAQWQQRPAALTWIHCQAMAGYWDAPWPYRAQFADQEDPDPPDRPLPPHGRVPETADPDTLLGWVWAYSGQVALWDECLLSLLDLWRSAEQPTMLIVIGARGYGLAEHDWWGVEGGILHGPRVHVPLWVGTNDGADPPARLRTQRLVQTRHVYHTLFDWLELSVDRGTQPLARDPLLAVNDTNVAPNSASLLTLARHDCLLNWKAWPTLAISRTEHQWLLRTPVWEAVDGRTGRQQPTDPAAAMISDETVAELKLYLKPDDVWDVNDVARLCPDVVSAFEDLLDQLKRLDWDDQGSDREVASLLSLDERLVTRPE